MKPRTIDIVIEELSLQGLNPSERARFIDEFSRTLREHFETDSPDRIASPERATQARAIPVLRVDSAARGPGTGSRVARAVIQQLSSAAHQPGSENK